MWNCIETFGKHCICRILMRHPPPLKKNILQIDVFFMEFRLVSTTQGGTERKSLNRTSANDVRVFCTEMKWLSKDRRKLCYSFPEMIPFVKQGVKNALKECRRQFSSYRWNCYPLDWVQVLTERGIVKKRKYKCLIWIIGKHFSKLMITIFMNSFSIIT